MIVPGTAKEIPISCTFTPNNAANITNLWVEVSSGGVTRRITLGGFNTTKAVKFGRDDHDRLTIMAGTTSLLQRRTPGSADDLLIPAGEAELKWNANVVGSIEFRARGRWL